MKKTLSASFAAWMRARRGIKAAERVPPQRKVALDKVSDALKGDDREYLAMKLASGPFEPMSRMQMLREIATVLEPDDLRFLSLRVAKVKSRDKFGWSDVLSNIRGYYGVVNSDGGLTLVSFDQAVHGRHHGKRVVVIDERVYVVNPDRFLRRTRYPILGSKKYPRVTYYGFFRENDPEQINLSKMTKEPDVTGAVVAAIINDKIVKDIMNPEKDFRPLLYVILGAVMGGMAVGMYFLATAK